MSNTKAPAQQVATFERAGQLHIGPGAVEPEVREEPVNIATATLNNGLALEPTLADDFDARGRSAAMDYDTFMCEVLEVTLHSPGGAEESGFYEGKVNGHTVCLLRDSGVVHNVPRFHVAVMAQAKSMVVRQDKITGGDGVQSYREKSTLVQTYPFSVVHDPSGRKGSDWLRAQVVRRTA